MFFAKRFILTKEVCCKGDDLVKNHVSGTGFKPENTQQSGRGNLHR
jgi:hypothetical protein